MESAWKNGGIWLLHSLLVCCIIHVSRGGLNDWQERNLFYIRKRSIFCFVTGMREREREESGKKRKALLQRSLTFKPKFKPFVTHRAYITQNDFGERKCKWQKRVHIFRMCKGMCLREVGKLEVKIMAANTLSWFAVVRKALETVARWGNLVFAFLRHPLVFLSITHSLSMTNCFIGNFILLQNTFHSLISLRIKHQVMHRVSIPTPSQMWASYIFNGDYSSFCQ